MMSGRRTCVVLLLLVVVAAVVPAVFAERRQQQRQKKADDVVHEVKVEDVEVEVQMKGAPPPSPGVVSEEGDEAILADLLLRGRPPSVSELFEGAGDVEVGEAPEPAEDTQAKPQEEQIPYAPDDPGYRESSKDARRRAAGGRRWTGDSVRGKRINTDDLSEFEKGQKAFAESRKHFEERVDLVGDTAMEAMAKCMETIESVGNSKIIVDESKEVLLEHVEKQMEQVYLFMQQLPETRDGFVKKMRDLVLQVAKEADEKSAEVSCEELRRAYYFARALDINMFENLNHTNFTDIQSAAERLNYVVRMLEGRERAMRAMEARVKEEMENMREREEKVAELMAGTLRMLSEHAARVCDAGMARVAPEAERVTAALDRHRSGAAERLRKRFSPASDGQEDRERRVKEEKGEMKDKWGKLIPPEQREAEEEAALPSSQRFYEKKLREKKARQDKLDAELGRK